MTGARPSSSPNSARSGFDLHPAAAMLAAALSLIAGCSLAQRAPAPAEVAALAPGGEAARARELTQALLERGRELSSMRTAAVMEYRTPSQHLKAHEELMVRRPQSLRVEALTPFGVALVVAAHDSRLQVFEPSSNTLYQGAASAQSLNRFAQIPLAPAPAANLLMGLAPDNDLLSGAPDSVRTEDELLVAVYRLANGAVTELGFAGPELAMVRTRSGNSRGYEVRYRDYRDIGGIQFAHEVEADFPETGTTVKFSYQRPIINGAMADTLFALEPGPATKELELDRAGLSSLAIGGHG